MEAPPTDKQFDFMCDAGATINRNADMDTLRAHSEYLNLTARYVLRSLMFQTLSASINYLAERMPEQDIVAISINQPK